jgi:hypothetical protein
MATVARRVLLRAAVGERLLTTKLQILNGRGWRRPSLALGILTGRVGDGEGVDAFRAPVIGPPPRRFAPHTVYLSAGHVHSIDYIIGTCQPFEPRRLTRSAVLRRAVEFLRSAVAADPAKSLLEND